MCLKYATTSKKNNYLNDYYINENFGNLIACLEEIILCIYTLEHIAIDCPELKEKSDLLRNKVITTFNPAIMQLVKSGENFKNRNAIDNIYNELNIKNNSNVIKEKVGKYDSIIIKYRDSTTENIKEIVKKAFYSDKSLNKDIDQTICTCHKQFNIIHNNKYIIKLDFSVSAFSEEEAIARIKRNEAMFDNIAKNINIEVYNEKEKQKNKKNKLI